MQCEQTSLCFPSLGPLTTLVSQPTVGRWGPSSKHPAGSPFMPGGCQHPPGPLGISSALWG